jgi:hypothetical protein
MKPFVIASIGRTGTMFLAELCNLSKTHEVIHEWNHNQGFLDAGRPEQYLRAVRESLLSPRPICHVNCYMKYNLSFFSDCATTALIYRPVREVILSRLNRTSEEEWDLVVRNQVAWYEYFHRTQQYQQPIIWFDQMTTDVGYLQKTIEWLGITDVEVTPKLMTKKVNLNTEITVELWEDVPTSIKKIVHDTGVYEMERQRKSL